MKKIIFISLLISANTIYAQVCFTPTSFIVDSFPQYITTADFNNDGKADIASASIVNSNQVVPGSVSVLLGNGIGGFSTPTHFVVGANPSCIINADFNGDGNIDLITANNGSNTVSLLLGNGLGSFATAINYTVCTGTDTPSSITSGDFNGDGKADFAVTILQSNIITIFLGDGLGGFGTPTYYASGNFPICIINVDFNADGKIDLAVAGKSVARVYVLLGNGSGAFSNPTSFLVGASPNSLTNADFNGDGKIDIATANAGSNDISILIGNGSGAFAAQTTFSVATNPSAIISADFNGDGFADVATANAANANNISVLIGNGAGSFAAAVNFSVGSQECSIISADFNGDTKTDLAVANYYPNKVSVLLNCYVTGIEEINNEQTVSVYPNPTSNNFTIETNTTEKQILLMYDVNGKLVLSHAINGKATIDAGNLSAGVYNANIISNKSIVNKKLVIVK